MVLLRSILVIFLVVNLAIFCLKITVNEELVLRRPISTLNISAILKYLLEEGDFSNLVHLLRLKTINVPKIYIDSLTQEHNVFFYNAMIAYSDGTLPKEEAKMILPARLIKSLSDVSEFEESAVLALPENPLSDVELNAANLKESALIAAIQRGLDEKDQSIYWICWPLEIPYQYQNVWDMQDIWRVLLIQSFCDGRSRTKQNFLNVLKSAVDQISFPSSESTTKLLMLNISLFIFYLELQRMSQVFNDTNISSSVFATESEELIKFAHSIFDSIVLNPARKGQEIFAGFDVKSAQLLHNLPEMLLNNRFHYESRIELFVQVVERLQTIPDIFADWFSNFYACFSDVVPKMSLTLLVQSWQVYLSFKPTIESICCMILWFHGRIKEEYRFKLAKEIPSELLSEFYRSCQLKFIPQPLELFPYTLRKTKYLRHSRSGTKEIYFYGMESIWTVIYKPISILVTLFEFMKLKQFDLFETVDTNFILNRDSGGEVGIRQFIEMFLNLFLKIKEWYIPMSSNDSNGLVIVTSPLLPPSFIPFLVQLIVRCRHLSCKAPFKISERYLMLTFSKKDSESLTNVEDFVKTQLNYLMIGSHLPKLTQMYDVYFSHLKLIEEQTDSSPLDYFNLYELMKSLWKSAEYPKACILTAIQIIDMENVLFKIISKTLELFNLELYNRVGRATFSNSELFKFFYN